jgi:hypothetical protein
MGWVTGWHKQDLVQTQLVVNLASSDQVAVVNRVKGAAEDTQTDPGLRGQ